MKKLFRRLFIIMLFVFTFFCANTIYNGYTLYKDKTNEIPLEEKVTLIKEQQNYVSYNDIPNTFINALVSIEDHRFFEHNGIDIQSILRAVVTDIVNMKLVEGGSTITQQLAKNMYYTQDKNFSRKVAEVFTVFDIEKKYSKEEILELYLNIVYFGDGYYGIYNASTGYFNKVPSELNLDEVTTLAGIPNAPSVYALSNSSSLTKKRQEMVVDAMLKYDCITLEEADKVKNDNK